MGTYQKLFKGDMIIGQTSIKEKENLWALNYYIFGMEILETLVYTIRGLL